MKNPPHPGQHVLRDCLEPLGLSITRGADILGVTRLTLGNLVNGKNGISPEMAIRLSKAFGGCPEVWLGMQTEHDLARAMKTADHIKVKPVARSAGADRAGDNVGSEAMSSRSEARLVTKAAMRAAKRLGLSHKELSRILGLSISSVSRMRSGIYDLNPRRKSYELALLFIQSYQSLDSIVGSDSLAMKAWLRTSNCAIGGTPIARLMSVAGLIEVIAYLETRRFLV